MIGAIIGDLAAWTWENDHEKFYLSLISEKALLSEYGLSVLATADALDFNLFMNEAEYQEYIRSWFRVVNDDVVCYSEGVKEWIEKQDYNYNYNNNGHRNCNGKSDSLRMVSREKSEQLRSNF